MKHFKINFIYIGQVVLKLQHFKTLSQGGSVVAIKNTIYVILLNNFFKICEN